MTPRYTAESRVLLGIQNPRVANFESVLENIVPDSDTVRSAAYVVASREMARKVGYRLALAKSPPFNPEPAPAPGLLDTHRIRAIAGGLKDSLGTAAQATADVGSRHPETHDQQQTKPQRQHEEETNTR